MGVTMGYLGRYLRNDDVTCHCPLMYTHGSVNPRCYVGTRYHLTQDRNPTRLLSFVGCSVVSYLLLESGSSWWSSHKTLKFVMYEGLLVYGQFILPIMVVNDTCLRS